MWVPAVALLFAACAKREGNPVEAGFEVMGTYASVKVPVRDAARLSDYEAATHRVMNEAAARMSVYRADSEISAVNRAAGTAAVPVSSEIFDILQLAKSYGVKTGGAFDVTVGPLMSAWGFRGPESPTAVPSDDQVAEAMSRVGYRHIELTNGTARLAKAGMRIDLGGIGKGYAVDSCVAVIKGQGGRDFLVNLGGNMRCLGSPREGHCWRIGVRNPFDRGELIGTLTLKSDRAVATSGNYERFVTIAGRRYAHIMDPRTGRPVEGMAGVTVTAPTAADADALSTALFVLGVEEGSEALRHFPGCEALFVPDRRPIEIWVTAGMKQEFTPWPDLAGAVRVIAQPEPHRIERSP